MLCASGLLVACGTSDEAPITIRLVDQLDTALVEGTVPIDVPEPVAWRFDDAATLPLPAEHVDTFGWRVVSNVEPLAVREGLLVGRTDSGGRPTLSARLPDSLDVDILHAVEVRMRVSGGSHVGVWFGRDSEAPDRERPGPDWPRLSMLLEPGGEFQTYRLTDVRTLQLRESEWSPRVQHIVLEPTDANGAEFAIESIRLISRREHLRSIPTGSGWHGLRDINRETIVSRSPQRIHFEVDLESRPWLDLAVGTIEEGPVRFTVTVGSMPNDTMLLQRTVTMPGQWEQTRLDLSDFAGQRVTVSLGLYADQPGRLGFWGSPVVRHDGALPQRAETSAARAALPDAGTSVPQGVIVILADTLRRDHLDAYGYPRPTAPVVSRLASEGALFLDNISQAPLTKISVPSILSSLYPSTHGVLEFRDLLPSPVVTLAETYRDAGYATFHTSANSWAGSDSRLQQGVEVLHEGGSVPATPLGRTSRPYVTRFLDWLDGHDDVPFFAFLHFFDAHGPHNPKPPYDTMWATPEAAAEQEERLQILKEAGWQRPYTQLAQPPEAGHSGDLRDREAAIALLQQAGVDPEAFLAHELASLDGEIRAMDVEIGRLLEGLEARGLGDKTLVAFISDHGDEVLDHGSTGHGHTLYGELLNVPLLLWWPGVVPEGTVIEETVESIDLMPTLLDLTGLAIVEEAQGQSLVPFLARPEAASSFGWQTRGAFSEKAAYKGSFLGWESASAIVLDGWKLIHNDEPLKGRPEYELYDHRADPLNLRDVARENPDLVERLGRELARRRELALAARIPPDDTPAESLSSEDVRRLRAMGYLR